MPAASHIYLDMSKAIAITKNVNLTTFTLLTEEQRDFKRFLRDF